MQTMKLKGLSKASPEELKRLRNAQAIASAAFDKLALAGLVMSEERNSFEHIAATVGLLGSLEALYQELAATLPSELADKVGYSIKG